MAVPATVRFIGDEKDYRISCSKGDSGQVFCQGCSSKKNCKKELVSLFTKGQLYDAFFVEYWEGVRDSLHVRANDESIHDFIHLGDFEIVSDPDNVLNMYEAIVKCITHRYDEELFDLKYGKTYTAIGCDKDRYYLVMDESMCCYYYWAEDFEIIHDPHHILEHQSVYRSYLGGMTEEEAGIDVYRAHKYCSNHKPELEKDEKCGCFYCLSIFDPKEIEEWIFDDNPADKRGTAICPYCGIDSVIGESSGYPITKDFLNRMYKVWFDSKNEDR